MTGGMRADDDISFGLCGGGCVQSNDGRSGETRVHSIPASQHYLEVRSDSRKTPTNRAPSNRENWKAEGINKPTFWYRFLLSWFYYHLIPDMSFRNELTVKIQLYILCFSTSLQDWTNWKRGNCPVSMVIWASCEVRSTRGSFWRVCFFVFFLRSSTGDRSPEWTKWTSELMQATVNTLERRKPSYDVCVLLGSFGFHSEYGVYNDI